MPGPLPLSPAHRSSGLARTTGLRALLLLVLGSTLAGCNILGWAIDPIRNLQGKNEVLAQYAGLQGKKVAVLVGADDQALFEHPKARLTLETTISQSLTANVPGAQVMDPKEVIDFQNANPYWITMSYADLFARLGVERLVLVDLVEYRTHEPGNSQSWQGVITGNISVAEREAANPSTAIYATKLTVVYPPGRIGVLDASDQTIELGMVKEFTRQLTNLFYKHQEPRK